MATRAEIDAKIVDRAALLALVQSWKKRGETVVFTNGCFDILHYGHVDYLYRAAELGTKLVVALNTDASVRALKGPHRPLQDEKSRALVMSGLGCVSAVTFFDESTPEALINLLEPDVLVKGADYSLEQIAGAKAVIAAGGRVTTIALSPGYSTSAIEARARQQTS